jgi:hypothetical protein
MERGVWFYYNLDSFWDNRKYKLCLPGGEKEKFKKPDWLGDDVTEEDFVAGGMLCGKKYEDIESDLNRFSYKKI